MNEKAIIDFSKISKKAIRFSLKKTSQDSNDGKSKYGDMPALTSKKEWPLQKDGHPMNFVGQLNFTEIFGMYHKQNIELLPKEGILMFFIDDKKMYEYKYYYAFVYKTKFETGTPFEIPRQNLEFKPRLLVPEIFDSYPKDLEKKYFARLGIKEKSFTSEMRDNYLEKFSHDSYHQLLGYPYDIQDDPIVDILDMLNELPAFKSVEDFKDLNAYQIWEKNDRENIRKERIKIFEAKRSDWTLLWQIPSVYDAFGAWGDNGNVYIMVETDKLKKNEFSNLKVTWQCS